MRIPLDLYTLLGVPYKATLEQIQQAFEDRLQQLPRQQYSNAALSSRKQLLKQIYSLLTKAEVLAQQSPSADVVSPDELQAISTDQPEATPDPNLEVDVTPEEDLAALLAELTQGQDAPPTLSLPEIEVTLPQETPAPPEPPPAQPDSEGLDIEEAQLCGALLLLHEIGAYELIIKLGQAYLERPIDLNQLPTDISISEPDLILSMALAYLEYGRECWQQRLSEQAALSLQAGLDLLIEEQIFPEIQQEIQSDLAKLRPYRILDLMQLPESEIAERERGKVLLKEMLDERGGIEGNQNDASGLNVDDFLRFMQQLREYLTVEEQQLLFEQEATRPSAVAQYLAAYALVARGVAHGMPNLIHRADKHLKELADRQDIYLEQAMCRLLLGQPTAATQSAHKSQDQDSLTFIRHYSAGSPDWVPGLYLYTERWLQQEVYPYFRDLAEEQVDLDAYFNDPQIQKILNELSLTVTEEASGLRSGGLALPTTAPKQEVAVPPPSSGLASSDPWEDRAGSGIDGEPYPPSALANSGKTPPDWDVPTPTPPLSLQDPLPLSGNRAQTLRKSQSARRKQNPRPRRRLIIGVLVAAGLGGSALALTHLWQHSTPNATAERPLIQLEAPPIEIPGTVADGAIPPAPPAAPTASTLTQDLALQVIRAWQTLKAEAMGQQHAGDQLAEILVEPALSEWQGSVEDLRQQQAYWQYALGTLEIVNVNPTGDNQATVQARVQETAQFFQNGQAQADASYNNNYLVQYELVRQNDQWRIRGMQVVP